MGSFDVMALLPFVLIFGVFYFLILRPQQQKTKSHQNMLANLRRGDRVVTNGGLIGTISKIISNNEVQLELSEEVRVRQVRSMIAEVLAKTDPLPTTSAPKEPTSTFLTTVPSGTKKASSSKKGSRNPTHPLKKKAKE